MNYKKKQIPADKIRKFLEPGPIVLVSSTWKGKNNIMTMGWHTVMEFSPSLIGCIISSKNHSYKMIRKSKECIINIPTADLAKSVAEIGNCSGKKVNKFEKFNLTPVKGSKVKAPCIKECYANFECKIYDTRLSKKYNFFILEVIHAIAAVSPKYPRTIHYTGDGIFMVSGKHINLKKIFGEDAL
jgi:flavin reductase (DIM6/NTAB) family NADH-FMN oxidoreductase RutF